MIVLTQSGRMNPVYQDRFAVLQASIAGVQLSNSMGLVRRLAVKELTDYATELATISAKLCTEAGVSRTSHIVAGLTPEMIRDKVNTYFRVDIRNRSRRREIADARHCAAYICKLLTNYTLREIADRC